MKKIAATLLWSIPFLTPFAAFAVDESIQGSGLDLCPPGTTLDSICGRLQPGSIIGTAITFIFVIAIVIALVFLIYGGLKWIVSGGDKGKVEEARGTIIAAIIGLIVVFLSYMILNFVLGLFGLSVSTLKLPNLSLVNDGSALPICSGPGVDSTAQSCTCPNGSDSQGYCL